MNILLPLNIEDSKIFLSSGFTDLKPFINILGQSILVKVVESLQIKNDKLIIIDNKKRQ